MDRRRLAAVIAALMFALPGVAYGQSAGDEQYQDPFGGDQEQAEPTPEPEPDTPAASQTAQATPTPVPAATTAQATPAQEQLPRTGVDAGLVALGGAVLLAGGLALRVRVR